MDAIVHTLFRNIWRGLFCIMGESLISGIICCLLLLTGISKGTGVSLAIFGPLRFSILWIMGTAQCIWPMTPCRNCCLNMGNSKRGINFRMRIFRIICSLSFRENIVFSKVFIRRWKKLHTTRCVLPLCCWTKTGKDTISKYSVSISWSMLNFTRG